MRVIALASGSSGNATLIVAGETKLLVDAGLPTRALEATLSRLAIAPRQLAAVFLTHEHGDHVAAAGVLSRRYGIPIVANEHTLQAAGIGKVDGQLLPTGGSMRVGALRVGSFPLPHDGREPVGYWIEGDGARVCLATDLGYAPMELGEQVRAANLIILEANHDRHRLLNGPYSTPLKARVAGNTGHLSNEQAATCIVASASGRPQWLWLAHLSAVNNSPRRAVRTVNEALRAAGIESVRVAATLRDRRSLVWDSEQCFVQLPLLGGELDALTSDVLPRANGQEGGLGIAI